MAGETSSMDATITAKIAETFDFLNLAKNVHKIKEENAVVFLGNTGVGKTALIKTCYDDLQKLKSIAMPPGMGQYIIEDEDNKIKEGIISQTFIPEIIVCDEVAYCDTPGFQDTRNFNYALVGIYMIKNLVTSSKYIKFGIVVKYQCFESRNEFTELLRSLTEFINDIENYKNSIVLLVTKVRKDTEETKKGIAVYLEKIRKSLEENENEYSENFYKRSMSLLNIFLKQIDGSYPNIGLLMEPKEEGVLSDMNDFQNARVKIRGTIDKKPFSLVSSNNFSFTVSSKSKNCINYMIKLIENKILEIINSQNNPFNSFLTSLMGNSIDESDLNKKLSDLTLFFKQTLANLEKSNMKDFLPNFSALLKKFEIDDAMIVSEIKYYFDYISFLKEIDPNCTELQSHSWIESLNSILEIIEQNFNWSTFLLNVYQNLSFLDSYRTILNLGKITRNNFQVFVDNLRGLHTSNLDVTDNKLEILNSLLETMKKQETLFDEETNRVTLKGDFLTMSNLISALQQYDVNEVHMFALNTIFVDVDFVKIGNKFKLVMISPNFKVVDHRIIKLDGSNGSNCEIRKALTGLHGIEGNPGGAGGYFYGLYYNVSDSGRLEISANGGNGARGQDGGNGKHGANGEMNLKDLPKYVREEKATPRFIRMVKGSIAGSMVAASAYVNPIFGAIALGAVGLLTPKPNNKKILHGNINNNNVKLIDKDIDSSSDKDTARETFLASGEKGRDGRPAGPGGFGGHKGIIHISNQSSNILTVCEDGIKGLSGLHGKGGRGGKNKMAKRVIVEDTGSWFYTDDPKETESYLEGGYAESGQDYEGPVPLNRIYPENQVEEVNVHEIIRNYMEYLEISKENRYRRDLLHNMSIYVSRQ